MSAVLEPPFEYRGGKLWLDERIFGHRFYDDQTPWLVLLEFLAVYLSRRRDGVALRDPAADGRHEAIRYTIPRRLPIRELLFNNPRLDDIEKNVRSDGERWNEWLRSMAKFHYVRRRFDEFASFVRVVELFQNTAVELHAQRRWTSRFMFPYGPDCIYVDLSERAKGEGVEAHDRRFFARGGELLYLMLNRSGHGEELALAIDRRLLREDERWNRLARALMPGDHDPWAGGNAVHDVPIGYLPLSTRPEYRQLAEDWLALLRLDLPGPSLFDPLVRITALNMLLYLLRRSHEVNGDARSPRLVLEVPGARRSPVFELARDDYEADRARPHQAIEADARRVLDEPAWAAALQARDPGGAAFGLIKDRFAWKPKEDPPRDPLRVFEAFLKDATDRHRQHLANVLPIWTQRIGLRLARRGVGTWYAPSDPMLRALVLTTVQGPTEYRQFLAKLHGRYGLVLGVAEAEEAFGAMPADDSAFADNTIRLEARLRDLGLLERLSDDCAYVINPFRAMP